MVNKPVFGVGEWASHSENLYVGCKHGCLYCYAHAEAVTRRGVNQNEWATPRLLKKHERGFRFRQYDGTVMFPTTHDITLSNFSMCTQYLCGLLAAGNRVLIVSKPDPVCIHSLCKSIWWAKDRVLFRFTIGSANNDVLQLWEPHAPSFWSRLQALQVAHAEGFATSVSCEPMLDGRIDEVIKAVHPYVTDAIWLGRANYLVTRVAANGGGDAELKAARELAERWNDDAVRALYGRYKDDPLIKWKESIKKVVGLEIPTKKGLDI